MSTALIAWILLAAFGTSVLSGIFGMAGGMILMGIFAWLLPVQQAMILHAITQFFANASRAYFLRDHIYRRGLVHYLAGAAIVFLVFAFATVVSTEKTVFLILGISPFAAYALPKKWKLDFTRPAHAFLCGFLITFIQLLAGVGGPLLDSFFQNRSLTRHQTVATKAFTQTIAHMTKFIYYAVVVSSIDTAFRGLSVWLCAAVVPAAMVGTHIGKSILEKMSDKLFYGITQTLLLGVGALYIAKALWAH